MLTELLKLATGREGPWSDRNAQFCYSLQSKFQSTVQSPESSFYTDPGERNRGADPDRRARGGVKERNVIEQREVLHSSSRVSFLVKGEVGLEVSASLTTPAAAGLT